MYHVLSLAWPRELIQPLPLLALALALALALVLALALALALGVFVPVERKSTGQQLGRGAQ